jgi:hypothetical protein
VRNDVSLELWFATHGDVGTAITQWWQGAGLLDAEVRAHTLAALPGPALPVCTVHLDFRRLRRRHVLMMSVVLAYREGRCR